MRDQVGQLYAHHGEVPAEVRLLKLTRGAISGGGRTGIRSNNSPSAIWDNARRPAARRGLRSGEHTNLPAGLFGQAIRLGRMRHACAAGPRHFRRSPLPAGQPS